MSIKVYTQEENVNAELHSPEGVMVTEVSAGDDIEAKMHVKNLKAWFRQKQVLNGFDFKVATNKITAIIGPSGCGKSTLIRCMNRMHELTPGARMEGGVFLDGIDIYKEDSVEMRSRIGMVFQTPNPFPTMSVVDNAISGIKLRGRGKSDGKKIGKDELMGIGEEVLNMAGLWDEVKDDINKSGAALSGGQQQRLCIARALAVEPEVLLMDEPCSALDPASTLKIEELMQELKKDYTIVVVTHNMQQAARVSDYTAFLYMGELIEYQKTSVIFENPEKELTERYITGRFG